MKTALRPANLYGAFRKALPKAFIALLLVLCLPTLSETLCAEGSKQATYKSPQEAVEALVAAVKVGATPGIISVLGPEGEDIAESGDAAADASARQRFVTAYSERHEIRHDDEAKAVLILGNDEFPFPIPIVANKRVWRFDTAAGIEEILDRRIGENELAAMEVLRAYIDAQQEYATVDHDGKGLQYARRILSNEGKQDGLYWPTTADEPQSPLGPLVANARAEGYQKRGEDQPAPYHGYLFRVLTEQGKNAAGGARDYIVGGRMIGGFGMVAAPAEYGNSGVMTFIVNHGGEIYEKDLGEDTARTAAQMKTFNPDSSWTVVKND
ncbi:MAG: DUF2950 domain-containing protein [Hyphomicrobiaceae bacterium]